jgi:hypothetical protein
MCVYCAIWVLELGTTTLLGRSVRYWKAEPKLRLERVHGSVCQGTHQNSPLTTQTIARSANLAARQLARATEGTSSSPITPRELRRFVLRAEIQIHLIAGRFGAM